MVGDVVFACQKESEPTLSSWRLASGAPLRKVRLPGLPAASAAGDLVVCALRHKGRASLRQVTAASLSADGKALWTATLEGHERLAVADDVILASSDGSAQALSSSSGKKLWSHSFDEPLASWPLRHGPYLLVWTPKTIRCFEATSGRARWERPVTRYRYTSPPGIARPVPFRDLLVWSEGEGSASSIPPRAKW
jgi:outer membrane protein assembly factor BamB